MELCLAHTTPAITPEQVMAFAHASGDHNPIHLSDEAARAAGLPGAVLHGMFVVGQLEAFLARMDGFSIAEMQVRFVRPVPVGRALALSARPIGTADAHLHLRLLVKIDANVLVAMGEARLHRLP